jgi:hypothetical protein
MWHVKHKHDVNNNMGKWSYPKIIKKILERHKEKHVVKELQGAAIVGNTHILREVLL